MLILKAPKSVKESLPGLVTVVNWTMAPDGNKYLFFWSKRWQVMTDIEMPVKGFRSSERWQLIALASNTDVIAVFPGCQVKAWIKCSVSPPRDCYSFDNEIPKERKTKRNY